MAVRLDSRRTVRKVYVVSADRACGFYFRKNDIIGSKPKSRIYSTVERSDRYPRRGIFQNGAFSDPVCVSAYLTGEVVLKRSV
ncbi:MAG: hypothetical protein K2J73_13175, partial [Oscillospiraceae bacterium]|nr:hypothetical protein [Oscillospiraceae bacterium]